MDALFPFLKHKGHQAHPLHPPDHHQHILLPSVIRLRTSGALLEKGERIGVASVCETVEKKFLTGIWVEKVVRKN